MLVLTRGVGDNLFLDAVADIPVGTRIAVVNLSDIDYKRNVIRVGIEAPLSVKIIRAEAREKRGRSYPTH